MTSFAARMLGTRRNAMSCSSISPVSYLCTTYRMVKCDSTPNMYHSEAQHVASQTRQNRNHGSKPAEYSQYTTQYQCPVGYNMLRICNRHRNWCALPLNPASHIAHTHTLHSAPGVDPHQIVAPLAFEPLALDPPAARFVEVLPPQSTA